MGEAIVVVIAVVLVAGTFLLWKRQGNPPDNQDWPVERDTTSSRLYGSSDRPAGPDAEAGVTDGSNPEDY